MQSCHCDINITNNRVYSSLHIAPSFNPWVRVNNLSQCWPVLTSTYRICFGLKYTIPRIPVEIWEHIIDLVPDDTCTYWFQRRTLRACALTCRSWYPRSCIRLYRSARLAGDERTKEFAIFVRKVQSHLALRVRHIGNHTGSIRLPEHPTAHHLVPLLTAALPRTHLDIHTVTVSRDITSARPLSLGAATHDSWLRSYARHRSVHTLDLSRIRFDSLSYFVRFLLVFPSLQHLLLDNVSIGNLDQYPTRIARQKHLALHPLRLNFNLASTWPTFLSRLIKWLSDSNALLSTKAVSISVMGTLSVDPTSVDLTVSQILAYTSGASLKKFTFRSEVTDLLMSNFKGE